MEHRHCFTPMNGRDNGSTVTVPIQRLGVRVIRPSNGTSLSNLRAISAPSSACSAGANGRRPGSPSLSSGTFFVGPRTFTHHRASLSPNAPSDSSRAPSASSATVVCRQVTALLGAHLCAPSSQNGRTHGSAPYEERCNHSGIRSSRSGSRVAASAGLLIAMQDLDAANGQCPGKVTTPAS